MKLSELEEALGEGARIVGLHPDFVYVIAYDEDAVSHEAIHSLRKGLKYLGIRSVVVSVRGDPHKAIAMTGTTPIKEFTKEQLKDEMGPT